MHRNERAISSVVGVMLMLSVTILIAALVSTLAGGFGGGSSSPDVPQSTLGMRAVLNNAGTPNNITYFDHRGGDPFSITQIRVVFQSQNNKTSLSSSDVGDTCLNFSVIGDSDATTVRAGDTFQVIGKYSSYTKNGNDISGIQFGNVTFWKDEEVSWRVIDKASGTTIATGSLFL